MTLNEILKTAMLNELPSAEDIKAFAENKNITSADVNLAAINSLKEQLGINDYYDLQAKKNEVFSVISSAINEILPAKIADVFGQFAEIKSFGRTDEPIFNIEKIGHGRAKLIISKGARGGIYRAARLDNRTISVSTQTYTAGVYVDEEQFLSGSLTFTEMFNDIVEGFSEEIMKETYKALSTGVALPGYGRIGESGSTITSTKTDLGAAIDKVIPYVKQYGVPTIFGSYEALTQLKNETGSAYVPNPDDVNELRSKGFISVYHGIRTVELPNYLVDLKNEKWFYNPSYVFVMPSGAKPVKIALKGETIIRDNKDQVGGEHWDAEKQVGIALAMANNYAVIKVSGIETGKVAVGLNATDYE